jgi:hypothetical protein
MIASLATSQIKLSKKKKKKRKPLFKGFMHIKKKLEIVDEVF